MVDPQTAEDELRGALGEPVTAAHEIGFVAAARLFILIDLLADLGLDDEATHACSARHGTWPTGCSKSSKQ